MTDMDQGSLARTRRQHEALVNLVTDQSMQNGGFPEAARLVTETAAEGINVERVGVWLLSDDRTALRCVDLFERTPARHSKDALLDARNYPRYFDALAAGRAVAVHDARKDPRTNEFAVGYLVPQGITSMLDAPIRVSGEVVGIVCHEHVGAMREWLDDEVSFATQLADQVAQALVDEGRKQAEHLLRIQRDIAVAVSAASDATEALEHMLEHACRIDGIDCGGGYVVVEGTGCVELVAHNGLPRWFIERVSHYDADSPNAEIVMAGGPIYGHADDIYSPADEPLKRERLRALAVLPVRHQGQMVAVLNFGSHTRDEIDANARNTLESVAAHIGGVIARVRSEEALQESERRYRELAELLPEVVWEADRQGNLTFANRNAFDFFGYAPEDLERGLNVFQMAAAADAERIRNDFGQALLGQLRGELEYVLVKKDGTVFPAAVFVEPIVREGEPIGLRGIIIDVTRRKRVEDALRESESKYRSVVEQALEGLVGAQGIPPQLVFVNQAISEILGYSVDELLRSTPEQLAEIIHPEDREFFFQQYQGRLRGDPSAARYEVRVMRKDAQIRWLAISSCRVLHEGQPASQALFTDITEQVRARQRYRRGIRGQSL